MFAGSTSFVPSVLLLDISLLAILVIVAFAVVRMRSLFGIVMLQGVYSLVSAAWFVSLDAVDVAFTEAAVGAGISTVLMLSAMLLADRKSAPVPMSRQWGPLLICVFAGAAMFYALGDMPAFGDGNSPANTYVGMEYMARTAQDVQIPNAVTAVLGSYRGYDTFGEVLVIFSAGLGVLLLLGLNGNAGRWRAEPNGQRISAPAAPAAHLMRETMLDVPSTVTGKDAISLTAAPKTVAKKSTPKKPAAKKISPKKVATKTPAAKKATSKKMPANKVATKKAATKKATSKKTVAKKVVAKKTTIKAKTAPRKAVVAKKKTASKAKTSTNKKTTGGKA